MNLIKQSVEQISKENFRNYYDREQAEEEIGRASCRERV